MTPQAGVLYERLTSIYHKAESPMSRDYMREVFDAFEVYESAVGATFDQRAQVAEQHAKTVQAGAQLSVSRLLERIAELELELKTTRSLFVGGAKEVELPGPALDLPGSEPDEGADYQNRSEPEEDES